MNDNKYDIREFNSWLEKGNKERNEWEVDDAIKRGKIKEFFFDKAENVHLLTPTLGWNSNHLSILRKWMKIKDNEKNLEKAMQVKTKEKLEVEKTESFSKQSFENKEKKQLEEIYNILFPNQTYSFEKLKEKLEKLRIHDLSLELENEKKNYENLISSLKEELNDNKLSKILDLFLINEYEIANNTDILLIDFFNGKKDAYRVVLEINNVSEEKLEEILKTKKNIYSLENSLSKSNYDQDLKINENSSEDNYCLIEETN